MSRVFFSLLVMLGSITFHLSAAYEMAIVSMFRNEANYLKEWIEYHSMAGVEHFWLFNDNSTDNWQEVLQPYIDNGIVEVIYWPTPLGTNWIENQVNAFREGIKRARGNAKWVAVIDIDEFLLPMQDRTISKCLNKHFSTASAVYVNWRNFGTGGVFVKEGEPILFKLTACSLPTHPDNGIGKSIVRPECVDVAGIWYPHHFPLIGNAFYMDGNRKKMPFVGRELCVDVKYHDHFLRINHYVLRDEGFYRSHRLANAERRSIQDKNLLLEHYDSFSKVKNYSIINFIKTKHPDSYKKNWKE